MDFMFADHMQSVHAPDCRRQDRPRTRPYGPADPLAQPDKELSLNIAKFTPRPLPEGRAYQPFSATRPFAGLRAFVALIAPLEQSIRYADRSSLSVRRLL